MLGKNCPNNHSLLLEQVAVLSVPDSDYEAVASKLAALQVELSLRMTDQSER